MTEKKPRGAPKGNQNARKHGFYSQVLDEAQALQLDQALEVEGIDEEIAILRVKLLTLIDKFPDRVDLQVITANTIARLIRTRYNVSRDQHKPLYYRKGSRWVRAGLLCLNCLLFIPDPSFTPPIPTFPRNRRKKNNIDDGKKD